jgi:hypothetical protein
MLILLHTSYDALPSQIALNINSVALHVNTSFNIDSNAEPHPMNLVSTKTEAID